MTLKTKVIALIAAVAAVGMLFSAKPIMAQGDPAAANPNTGYGNSLSDLIVLNGLFNPGYGYGHGYYGGYGNLAGLIAVDNLAGGGYGVNSNLSDLIVLNGLFNPGYGYGYYGGYGNLAGLIAVDNITGGYYR